MCAASSGPHDNVIPLRGTFRRAETTAGRVVRHSELFQKLLPIHSRSDAFDRLEHLAEVLRLAESGSRGDLGDLKICLLQKQLCRVQPHASDLTFKGSPE